MQKKQGQHITYGIWLVFLIIGVFFAGQASSINSVGIEIAGGKGIARTRFVSLTIVVPNGATHMKIANDGLFVDDEGDKVDWEPIQSSKEWELPFGNGSKSVFVMFKDASGKETKTYFDSIVLQVNLNQSAEFVINRDDADTNSRYVKLFIKATEGVELVKLSNSKDFVDSEWIRVNKVMPWILSAKSGKKTVYAKFLDANEKTYDDNDSITYKQPEPYIKEGTLVKGPKNVIFYLGFDGRIHPFPSVAVYNSWYSDFSNITIVSDGKLAAYQMGSSVCMRPGTWLLKFTGANTVYAVEPGCQLRPIRSAVEAHILFGEHWGKRILTFDAAEKSAYEVISFSATELDEEVVDKDADGLDRDSEKQYSTADTKPDTDGDGVSDFEEAFYLYTDPSKPDTDGDGVSDGQELLKGSSPITVGLISELPEDGYIPTRGSVTWDKTQKRFVYRKVDGTIVSVAQKTNQSKFVSNHFSPLFVIYPAYALPTLYKPKGTIPSNFSEIVQPSILVGDSVVPL